MADRLDGIMNRSLEFQNGRDFILENLSTLGTGLQNIIRNDLFHSLDKTPLSSFEHVQKYESEIRKFCAKTSPKTESHSLALRQIFLHPQSLVWGLNIEKFLRSFKTDLALLKLVNTWHKPILLEVILLALTLRKIFFIDLDEIRQSLHPFRRKDQDFQKGYGNFPIGDMDTLGRLGERIEVEKRLIDTEIAHLVARLPHHSQKMALQKIEAAETEAFWNMEQRVPTATLRELLVRNEVWGRKDQILGCFKGDKVGLRKDISAQMQEVSSTIFEEMFSKFNLSSQDKTPTESAWLPQIIVIVADMHTGMVITGASQASCQKLVFLKETALKMNRSRLGTNFAFHLDGHCKVFGSRASELKSKVSDQRDISTQELAEMYDFLVSHTTPDLHITPPIGSHILCWAISGYTFQPEAPCLRCQYLYPTWKLHKAPEDNREQEEENRLSELYQIDNIENAEIEKREEEKAEERRAEKERVKKEKAKHFRLGLKRPSCTVNYIPDKSFACAESVAAAKIYALRHGTLALV